MKQVKTWHWASLFVAINLVMAYAAVPAAYASPIQQGQRPSRIIIVPGNHDHWLGLTVKDVNGSNAKQLKLPEITGAIVVSVIPDSPAAKAGFQKGDVILQFDGQRVRSVAQLHRLVEETPAGRTVKVEITRHGMLQTLQVTVENRGPNAFLNMPLSPRGKIWRWPFSEPPVTPQPEPFLEPSPKGKVIPLPPVIPKFKSGPLPNPEAPEVPHLWIFPKSGPESEARPSLSPHPQQENTLGISGQDLTPQLARFFGVKQGKGILVSQVEKGSAASAAGLKAGDVIFQVGSQQVGSIAELRQALRTPENTRRRITLEIVRNRQERELSVLLRPGSHGVKPEPIMSLR